MQVSSNGPMASVPSTQDGPDNSSLDGLPHICGCKELAEFLLVDLKTVQGLAQRHEVPCRKVGKAYLFYRPAVLAWLLGAENSRSSLK